MSEHPDEVDEQPTADAPPPVAPSPLDPSTDDVGPEGAAALDEGRVPEHEGPRQLRIVALVAVVALVVDQASKAWAVGTLSDGHIVDLVGSLRFNLAYNTGVAFSTGSGKGLGPWISVLALGVVVAVSLGATSRTKLGALASGLISGGAIGNLADRAFRGDDGFLHGAVIDFIDLQWWPIWNVADACVVVGACLLVLVSLRMPT